MESGRETPETTASSLPDELALPVEGRQRALTLRALLIALVATWLCGYWIRQAEIVALACQITESVPAIPGIAGLLVLLGLNVGLRRTGILRPLTLGELLLIFVFVTVGTTMFGCGIVRFLIASLSAPFYYSSPTAPLEELTPYLPFWLVPEDANILKGLYEGSPTGTVPWDVWLVPMLCWAGFFLLFGFTLLCLIVLVSRRWVEGERLIFPLVRLPLQIVHEESAAEPFFRNKFAWYGMGFALLLNAINMVRGVYFGGPSGGLRVDLGPALTEHPWRAMRPFTAHFRPELIGLGYLVSTEMSFSIWFFFLLTKFEAMAMSMAGLRLANAPFAQEQSIGGYLCLGAILLWNARADFWGAYRRWGRAREEGESYLAAPPWALIGAICGFVAICALCRLAGMSWLLAAAYFGILTIVGLVYARLRAETGVPLVWMFPYGMQHKVIRNFLGTRRMAWFGMPSLTMFTLLGFLSRGYFPTVSGYQLEALRLGQVTRTPRRDTMVTLMAAIGVGALLAFYFHLTPYYARGGVGLRGGIWGSSTAQSEYAGLLRSLQLPTPPDGPRIIATVSGAGMIALLTTLRAQWFACPFHPLGYAMATAYGDLIWAPFLLVWTCKILLLRYGGSKLYLRALPMFLGFALGHFVVAGAIWGSLGAALGGPFLRWGVWFG